MLGIAFAYVWLPLGPNKSDDIEACERALEIGALRAISRPTKRRWQNALHVFDKQITSGIGGGGTHLFHDIIVFVCARCTAFGHFGFIRRNNVACRCRRLSPARFAFVRGARGRSSQSLLWSIIWMKVNLESTDLFARCAIKFGACCWFSCSRHVGLLQMSHPSSVSSRSLFLRCACHWLTLHLTQMHVHKMTI